MSTRLTAGFTMLFSLMLLLCNLNCANPTAASDEVLFVNESSYYIFVTQVGGGTLMVGKNDNNKIIGVSGGFSVNISYSSDSFINNANTLVTNYSVSAGNTVTISNDLKVSK